MKNWTLSDFAEMEVLRTETEATLICDYFEGDRNKPVRLSVLGFVTTSDKSDFEIREEAWLYWLKFNEEGLKSIKEES